MPQYFALDKILKQGVEYPMAEDEFMAINALGTDSAGAGRLRVERQLTGDIKQVIAPAHKINTNLLTLLGLGDLYYVVPPKKKALWEGDSGSVCRVKGKLGILGAGEAMPAGMLARAAEQDIHFITFIEDSVSLGTDEVWAAGRELTVLELTPKTIEKYTLNNIALASVTGDTISNGQVGIRFYLEGKPIDNLSASNLPLGIDALSMPSPPAETTESIPFSFKDNPVEVGGDKTLKITAINISGGDLTPATGSAWSVTVTCVVEYLTKRA